MTVVTILWIVVAIDVAGIGVYFLNNLLNSRGTTW